jgi:hypothetical protein
MKASSSILLVFITIVFFYVVVIFRVFTPGPVSNTIRAPSTILSLPPPLDTSVITELEGRIHAEHTIVLQQKDKIFSLGVDQQKLHQQHEEDQNTMQTQLSQIQSLSSQLETLRNPEHDTDVNSFLLESRDKEISELKTSLDLLRASSALSPATIPLSPISPSNRPGVIVLGMHRSGTSVIGGLMNKMGLETGGPLIGAAKDNAKGFFERIDVVLQNDYLFKNQNVHYAYNTHKYDAMRGLRDIIGKEETKFFSEGRRALKFLNNENNYPWMLKDPRLCITLRTWLPLLNFVPAILFAYRNPYDVALSMHTRETEHFPIQRGLKLWYIYNKRAIRQSNDLCRVVTSHKRVLTDPKKEMASIFDGLRACGVEVPHLVRDDDIKSFVDTTLQHGKTKSLDLLCTQENVDFDTLLPPDTWSTADATNLHLYRACIRAFCDIENGVAFLHDYKWDESITNS